MNRDPLGIGRLLYGFGELSPAGPGYLLAAGPQWMTLIPDGHGDCGISTFCKNPLHPGPCKGWKKHLGMNAPGALNAIEKAHKEKVAAKRVARNEAKSKASKALTGRQLSSPLHAKKATIKASHVILGDDEAKAGKKANRVILNKAEIKKYSKIKAAQMNAVFAKHGMAEDTGLEDRIADALAKDNVGGKDDNYRSVIASSSGSLGAHIANKECKKGDGDCDGKPYENLRDALTDAAEASLLAGDDEHLDATLKDYAAGKLDVQPKGPAGLDKFDAAATDAEKLDALDAVTAKQYDEWPDSAKADAETLVAGKTGPQAEGLQKKLGVTPTPPSAPKKKAAKKAPAPLEGTAAQAEKGKDFGLGLMAMAKGNKTLGSKAYQQEFADKIKKQLDGDTDKPIIEVGAEVVSGILITQAQKGNMAQPTVNLTSDEEKIFQALLKAEIEDGLKGGDAPKPVTETFKKAINAKHDQDWTASTEAKAEMDGYIKKHAAEKLGLDPNLSQNVIAAHILFDPSKSQADGKFKARLQVLEGMTKEEFDGLPEGHQKVVGSWLEGRAEHLEDQGEFVASELDDTIALQKKFGLPEHQKAEPDVLQDLLNGVPEATGEEDDPFMNGTFVTAKEAFGPDGVVDHETAVKVVEGMDEAEWNGLTEDEKTTAMDNITDAMGMGEPGSSEAMDKIVGLFELDEAKKKAATPPPVAPSTPSLPPPSMGKQAKKAYDFATGAKSGTATQKAATYKLLEGEDFAALPPEVQQLILADLQAAKVKFIAPNKKMSVQETIDYLSPYAGGGAGAGGSVGAPNPGVKSEADKINDGADWSSKFVSLLNIVGGPKAAPPAEVYAAGLAMLQGASDNGKKNDVVNLMSDIWAGEAMKKIDAMHADPLGTSAFVPGSLDAAKPALAADIAKKFGGEPGPTPVLDAWVTAINTGDPFDADAFMAQAHPGAGPAAGDFNAPPSPADIQDKSAVVNGLWGQAGGPDGMGDKPGNAPSEDAIAAAVEAALTAGTIDSFADATGASMSAGVMTQLMKKTGVPPIASSPADNDKIGAALAAEFAQAIKSGKSTTPGGGINEKLHDIAAEVQTAGNTMAHNLGVSEPNQTVTDYKTSLMAAKLTALADTLSPGISIPSAPAKPAKATKTVPKKAVPLSPVSIPDIPETPPVPAGETAPEPVLGQGDGVSHIPSADVDSFSQKFHDLPVGTSTSDPIESVFDNLLGLAATEGGKFGGMSILQAAQLIDIGKAKKYGGANKNLVEKKLISWLGTKGGKEYVDSYGTTPKADVIKWITSPSAGSAKDKPITLQPGQKVQTLAGGPGPYDPNKPASDFKKLTDQQAQAELSKYFATTGDHWTPKQKQAITAYTGSQYHAINDYLRGTTTTPTGQVVEWVKNIQAGMRPMPSDQLVVRGSSYKIFPEGFRSLEGVKKLAAMGGVTLKDDGFVSTSVAGSGGEFDKKIKLHIEAPEGTMGVFVKSISSHPGENELMLAAGTRYQLISVDDSGSQPIVRLRVIS